jgi:hypothetical protein
MKTNFLKSLGLLSLMTALITGCPTSDQIATSVSQQLAAEQYEYDQLVNAQRDRGETVVQQLERWQIATGGLYDEVASLQKRLTKKPGERSKVENKLQELRERLDVIFARKVDIRLLVPGWQLDKAREAARYINDAVNNLRHRYSELYAPATASRDGSLNIEIKLDKQLYDTYNDCVDAIKIVGLAKNDSVCATEARRNCTHQMDMRCVAMKATLGAVEGCSRKSKDANDQPVVTPAAWLSEIRACISQKPVFRN